jgi:hypothetical protein
MSISKERDIGGFFPHLGLETIGRLDGADTNLPAQRETRLTGGPIRHWLATYHIRYEYGFLAS